jgi:hypothetical protein
MPTLKGRTAKAAGERPVARMFADLSIETLKLGESQLPLRILIVDGKSGQGKILDILLFIFNTL